MNRAFSLVELSIVLVILGLLVGGVLSGQSLIRAAELRSVVTEYNKYQTALNSFKDRYFAIPGDFINATQFWGAQTCGSGGGPGTMNGDGNGYIDYYTACGAWEPGLFWQHLTLAGLVEGGAAGINPIYAYFQTAKLGSGIYWISDIVQLYNNATCNDPGSSGAALYGKGLMQTLTLSTTCKGNGVMKSEEAWNIDTKIDDGKADQGKLLVANPNGVNSGCIDAPPIGTGGNFQLSDTSTTCKLFFVLW